MQRFERFYRGRRRLRLPASGLWVAVFFFLLPPNLARAHKVNVFAWVESGTVVVEGYFAGGRKAKNALVEVFGPDGAKIVEGRTDSQGQFSFRPTAPMDLRIVLTASMGHKNHFDLAAAEFAAAGAQPASLPAWEPKPGPRPPAPGTTVVTVDLQRLQEVVDRTLERRLQPLTRKLHEAMRPRGPGITEIIGGIGYIVGLVGIALYLGARRRLPPR